MQHQMLGRQDYPYEAVMPAVAQHHTEQIGRASCRERVCYPV